MSGGGGRKGKKEIPEEHENHERWMVTYADMVTLLMVLFIVMFAMSQVDQAKYNALRSGLAVGFGGQTNSFMEGGETVLEQSGSNLTPELVTAQSLKQLSQEEQSRINAAVSKHDRDKLQAQYAAAAAEVSRLQALARRVKAALAKEGLGKDVLTSIDDRGLVVSLVSQHVVFYANLATLSPRGARVVDVLAPVLRQIPDPLRIDGHTNQVPVRPKYYATDWDLSAARSITVLRRLNENGRVPMDRLSASAFGNTKPLWNPKTKGSQQVNKRVDIVVLSGIPAESRALLDNIVAEQRANEGEEG